MAGTGALVSDIASNPTDPWQPRQPGIITPGAGIIPSPNQMWLNPGMLLEPGMEFGSALKKKILDEGTLASTMDEASNFLASPGGPAGAPGGARLQTTGPGSASLVNRMLGSNVGLRPESAKFGSPDLFEALSKTGQISPDSLLQPGALSKALSLTGEGTQVPFDPLAAIPFFGQGGAADVLSSIAPGTIASAATPGSFSSGLVGAEEAFKGASTAGAGGAGGFLSAAGPILGAGTGILGAIQAQDDFTRATQALSVPLFAASLNPAFAPVTLPLAIISSILGPAKNFFSGIFGGGGPSADWLSFAPRLAGTLAGERQTASDFIQSILNAKTPQDLESARQTFLGGVEASGVGGFASKGMPPGWVVPELPGATGTSHEGGLLWNPNAFNSNLNQLYSGTLTALQHPGQYNLPAYYSSAVPLLEQGLAAPGGNDFGPFPSLQLMAQAATPASSIPKAGAGPVGLSGPIVARVGGGAPTERSAASPEALVRMGVMRPEDAALASASLDAMRFLS